MSAIVVGVAEAHDRLSELIDHAIAGTEVVIAKRSRPVVRLTAVASQQPEANGPRLATMCARWRAEGKMTGTSGEIDERIQAERGTWERSRGE